MAASRTLHQLPHSLNSATLTAQAPAPPHGVLTLFGYGISVRVERGHLTYKDGIGTARREARFPRVRHGLRRLVVIGSDGMVSLAALRWLADQDAAFVMLDRDGSVLLTTGPVRPSDAKLRRTQALAYESGMALRIARELIFQKLMGQEQVARDKLRDASVAQTIAETRLALAEAESLEAVAAIEKQAALAYWSGWHSLPVMYPRNDLARIPKHWLTFGARRSPLTGSPRLAVNPLNAILNYLYAVLESEARLAAAALGLDPGLGVMHVDTRTRDSFACDLMEPIRPQVDAYLLDWILREPLRRGWFFEQRDGSCRLMGAFAAMLSETAPTWARAIAPVAEWVTRTLWSGIVRANKQLQPATRLTQGHRREAKGNPVDFSAIPAPRPPVVCRACGGSIARGSSNCLKCAQTTAKETFLEVAKLGRLATHSPKAEALRGQTQKRQRAAEIAWKPSDKPEWLDERTYCEKILPRLASFSVRAISSALSISVPYASGIRAGRRIPHPRHWQSIAKLVQGCIG
ncbi:MAG TPA: CRISPR-associated endonuclease Cas1 [Terriglobia bacterium]|nr:CRISPR-associated endonuclease Cas1 [Terriglobia bacterium]